MVLNDLSEAYTLKQKTTISETTDNPPTTLRFPLLNFIALFIRFSVDGFHK